MRNNIENKINIEEKILENKKNYENNNIPENVKNSEDVKNSENVKNSEDVMNSENVKNSKNAKNSENVMNSENAKNSANEKSGMVKDNLGNIVLEKIRDSECVLVGIGEEFGESIGTWEESSEYSVFKERVSSETEQQWMQPFAEELYVRGCKGNRVRRAYKILEELLDGKNYFIVSVRTDDYIYDTALKQGNIVTPCGGYRYLQCPQGCNHIVCRREERLLEGISAFLSGKGCLEDIKAPVCPVCGKIMLYNNIKVQNYVEEGYLELWNRYKKWLQGTVNRKLCVLELGVGMKYPSVIRWPFEKIVFFNQKSSFFRVHSKLYQLTEEISERGYKIKEKPIDFLINRFV